MSDRRWKREEMKPGMYFAGFDTRDGEIVPVLIGRDPVADDGDYPMYRLDTGNLWSHTLSLIDEDDKVRWYHVTGEFTQAFRQIVEEYDVKS
jgi:hypothetical protein